LAKKGNTRPTKSIVYVPYPLSIRKGRGSVVEEGKRGEVQEKQMDAKLIGKKRHRLKRERFD